MTNNKTRNNLCGGDESGSYHFLNTFAKQNPSSQGGLEVFLICDLL